jgi:hypothetical protein
MFPVFIDAAKFDATDHRGRLQALSGSTFALLRHVQPFKAQPDHLSNVLWWLDELPRIDRHRYGHTLAPHIDRVRIGFKKPLEATRDFLPNPPKPVPVDDDTPLPMIEVKAPAGWDDGDVRDHLHISDAASSFLDVPEWKSRSSNPMAALDLAKRMAHCERQVLDGIVNPLATGNINLSPPAGAGEQPSP